MNLSRDGVRLASQGKTLIAPVLGSPHRNNLHNVMEGCMEAKRDPEPVLAPGAKLGSQTSIGDPVLPNIYSNRLKFPTGASGGWSEGVVRGKRNLTRVTSLSSNLGSSCNVWSINQVRAR